MTYENDAVFQTLGRELLEARHARDVAQHLLKHAGADATELGKMLAEHNRELLNVLRKHHVPDEYIRQLSGLVVAGVGKAAWMEMTAKVGECSCASLVDRAAVDVQLLPPTPEQIERGRVEPVPDNVRRLPLRKFAMVVKPPSGGGGAA